MSLAVSPIESREHAPPRAYLPPRRILVVVDPAGYEQPALEKAVRIATRCGSRLELYVCDVEQQIPESWAGGAQSDQFRELRRQRQLEELGALVQPLRARGLVADVACAWHAAPGFGMAHHALQSQADLVVKERQRHAWPSGAGTGGTDWNLLRQLPMPLLLVCARAWPADLEATIRRDTRSLAALLGGTLDAIEVWQVPPQFEAGMVPAQLARVDCDLLVVKPHGHVSPLPATDE